MIDNNDESYAKLDEGQVRIFLDAHPVKLVIQKMFGVVVTVYD